MGGRRNSLETAPDLSFVRNGTLNMILIKGKTEQEELLVRVAVDSQDFLEDTRLVRSSSMDTIHFNRSCVFKFTLDFVEPMPCACEVAVRESTDWVLCSCDGGQAYYSKIEKRLVLQQCYVSIQSTVEPLTKPFVVVLRFDDDMWIVERVLR